MTMRVPYKKPVTLSDPYLDWECSGAEIAKVIATDPEDLGSDDYWMIFYQNLPAANYQEGCFYVPHFLEFYAQGIEYETRNVDGFFWFIDHFRKEFEQDGLLKPILERIWTIFMERTKTFSIHRLSDEELERYKISESFREMVPGSRSVHQLLDCFTSWQVYDPTVVRLKEHFSNASSKVKSFWFCECAFHSRSWLWVDSEPVERRQDLFDFFHRLERFATHYNNTLRDNDMGKGFSQYNRRISPT